MELVDANIACIATTICPVYVVSMLCRYVATSIKLRSTHYPQTPCLSDMRNEYNAGLCAILVACKHPATSETSCDVVDIDQRLTDFVDATFPQRVTNVVSGNAF